MQHAGAWPQASFVVEASEAFQALFLPVGPLVKLHLLVLPRRFDNMLGSTLYMCITIHMSELLEVSFDHQLHIIQHESLFISVPPVDVRFA